MKLQQISFKNNFANVNWNNIPAINQVTPPLIEPDNKKINKSFIIAPLVLLGGLATTLYAKHYSSQKVLQDISTLFENKDVRFTEHFNKASNKIKNAATDIIDETINSAEESFKPRAISKTMQAKTANLEVLLDLTKEQIDSTFHSSDAIAVVNSHSKVISKYLSSVKSYMPQPSFDAIDKFNKSIALTNVKNKVNAVINEQITNISHNKISQNNISGGGEEARLFAKNKVAYESQISKYEPKHSKAIESLEMLKQQEIQKVEGVLESKRNLINQKKESLSEKNNNQTSNENNFIVSLEQKIKWSLETILEDKMFVQNTVDNLFDKIAPPRVDHIVQYKEALLVQKPNLNIEAMPIYRHIVEDKSLESLDVNKAFGDIKQLVGVYDKLSFLDKADNKAEPNLISIITLFKEQLHQSKLENFVRCIEDLDNSSTGTSVSSSTCKLLEKLGVSPKEVKIIGEKLNSLEDAEPFIPELKKELGKLLLTNEPISKTLYAIDNLNICIDSALSTQEHNRFMKKYAEVPFRPYENVAQVKKEGDNSIDDGLLWGALDAENHQHGHLDDITEDIGEDLGDVLF
jgi:hypothetical protein